MQPESSSVSNPDPSTELANRVNAYASLLGEVGPRMRSLDEGLGKDVSSSIEEFLSSAPQPSTARAAVVKLIESHSTAMRELGSFLLEIADRGATLSRDLTQSVDTASEVGPEKSTRDSQTPYGGIPAKALNDTHEGADSTTKADIRSFSPDVLALKAAFDRILGEDSANNPKMNFCRPPKDRLYKK